MKGRDDLRQDAVMQQVFGLVNRLLLKEPATAKRKLSVRTYKVSINSCEYAFNVSFVILFSRLIGIGFPAFRHSIQSTFSIPGSGHFIFTSEK